MGVWEAGWVGYLGIVEGVGRLREDGGVSMVLGMMRRSSSKCL